MKRNFFYAVIIIFIFQLIGCTAIYRHVRDKKERLYNEGVELYKQNNIEEANDRFETVVNIEPEYKDAKQYLEQTKKIIAANKRNIRYRSNVNYDKGLVMMKSGRYDDALPLLLLAKEQNPDHTDVNDKIDKCRKKLTPKFENLLKTAEQQYQQGQYFAAYNTCLKAKTYDPVNNQLYSTMKKIEDKLDSNAEKYVDRAKKFYGKKQYTSALSQYQLALQANPWNKDIKEMVDKTKAKLELDKNYQNGITLYNKGDYFGAKESFDLVNFAESNYKDTDRYMTKINAALVGQVGHFYNNGVASYNKGNYEAAIVEFKKVLSINPGNTDAKEYLQRTETKLEIQKSVGGGTE